MVLNSSRNIKKQGVYNVVAVVVNTQKIAQLWDVVEANSALLNSAEALSHSGMLNLLQLVLQPECNLHAKRGESLFLPVQCQVCRQSFLCTAKESVLKSHQESKHPKNTMADCFPSRSWPGIWASSFWWHMHIILTHCRSMRVCWQNSQSLTNLCRRRLAIHAINRCEGVAFCACLVQRVASLQSALPWSPLVNAAGISEQVQIERLQFKSQTLRIDI